MEDKIIHFIITVLVIYGIKASTSEGMIFHSLYVKTIIMLTKVFKDTNVIMFILKPLYDCTPCMASFWGTISFVIYDKMDYIYLPVWVFALSGFNYILNKLLK